MSASDGGGDDLALISDTRYTLYAYALSIAMGVV